ncbi:MAG: SDR family oxidoreductase [Candidatus Nanoarchaeia archaeon]|nr:SDR family oxidoreductase [Candidatus Nanoarchaeia archaeon]
MRLKDKVAIITGAASGIGRSSALLFAKEGAKIVVADYNEELGKETVSLIKKEKGEAIFVKTDVSNEKDIKNMIDQTIKSFKKIDILYNNAGIELGKNILDTTPEEWDNVISINLKGVFLGCKYAIPYIKKGGSIINTSSIAGIVGFANLAAYCASKGGIILLTKQMALDFAKKGIRVNCICPGGILTPMLERFIKNSPDPQATRKGMDSMHPLGRVGKPEEVAYAALFLASDESSFITGHSLIVDGGFTSQ